MNDQKAGDGDTGHLPDPDFLTLSAYG